MLNHHAIVSALVLGSLLALGGCAVEPVAGRAGEDRTAIDDGTSPDTEEHVASAQEAISFGWTPYTSEEYPPVGCDPGSLVDSVACSGWYCDNVALGCYPTYATAGYTTWTPYFSEEGTNYQFCPAGTWLTGIACSGAWCDNIALQCTYLYNRTPANCTWTGWVSEEYGGILSFGTGYYARGAQCSGSYCDNKRFYVCQWY